MRSASGNMAKQVGETSIGFCHAFYRALYEKPCNKFHQLGCSRHIILHQLSDTIWLFNIAMENHLSMVVWMGESSISRAMTLPSRTVSHNQMGNSTSLAPRCPSFNIAKHGPNTTGFSPGPPTFTCCCAKAWRSCSKAEETPMPREAMVAIPSCWLDNMWWFYLVLWWF